MGETWSTPYNLAKVSAGWYIEMGGYRATFQTKEDAEGFWRGCVRYIQRQPLPAALTKAEVE